MRLLWVGTLTYMDISSEEVNEFLKVCQTAASAGGAELIRRMGKASVSEKNPGDFVTEADLASQQAIRDIIHSAFPAHSFVGEEDSDSQAALEQLDEQEFCWIVDPLDGTTNYIHQLRSFSVSVALTYRGQVIVGTVLDPVLNENYYASRGNGAFLNGTPIRTSDCNELGKSLLVCSFSSRVAADSPEIKRFVNIMQKVGSVRRLGSAALNFCYVACGRLDAYWATCVNAWDVAAGTLILEEAGGVISGLDGQPFHLSRPRFVASANPQFESLLRPLTDLG